MSAARAEDRPNIILVVELTPDKKVVWVLQGLEEGVLYCLRRPDLVSGGVFRGASAVGSEAPFEWRSLLQGLGVCRKQA
jgi:hypothetical protein